MENNKFALISDFDGTLTNKDFHQMIIDDFLGEEGWYIFNEWKEKKYSYQEYLKKIYNALDKKDKKELEDILRIEWDDSADRLIKRIQKAGGEFIILSYGTGYYIERLLAYKGLTGVKIYSNENGDYKEGENINANEEDAFFLVISGADKVRIINNLKEKYPYIYYVGDSLADIVPCKIADKCFAKGALQQMLEDQKVDFIPINNFKDIERYLLEKEVISNEGEI